MLAEIIGRIAIERTPQRLYTMEQAAQVLGLSLAAIRAQTWRGRIRTVKLGRRVMVAATEIQRIQETSA